MVALTVVELGFHLVPSDGNIPPMKNELWPHCVSVHFIVSF